MKVFSAVRETVGVEVQREGRVPPTKCAVRLCFLISESESQLSKLKSMDKLKITRKQRLQSICKEKESSYQDHNIKQVGFRAKQRNKVKKGILL